VRPDPQVAPSVGWHRPGDLRVTSLQWGVVTGLADGWRLSVLLPERSNHCDQRFCAFGGHRLKVALS